MSRYGFIILSSVFYIGCGCGMETSGVAVPQETDNIIERPEGESEQKNDGQSQGMEKIVIDAGSGVFVDDVFSVTELRDSLFATMDGVSFRKGAPVKRSDLRDVSVLHYDFDSKVRVGRIICHKLIAQDILEIFRELYEIGYQIESILPVDNFGGDDNESMKANNTSCFNYRSTPGGSRLSYHAYGTAIDINPLYNPYVRKTRSGAVVLPEEGKRYADRSVRQKGMIQPGDECVAIFKKHGFTWGGDWVTVRKKPI